MSATFVGHYPWFVTYNTLQEKVPTPDGTAQKLVRNAGIGFAASLASDTTSNSLRVLKVTIYNFFLFFLKLFSDLSTNKRGKNWIFAMRKKHHKSGRNSRTFRARTENTNPDKWNSRNDVQRPLEVL